MLTKKQQLALLNETLLTPEKFNDNIEKTRVNFDTYLDTIHDYCEQHNLELKIVKKLLNSQILSKLTAECEELHLVKRNSHFTPLF
jgi:hypothetical protein